MSAGTEVVIHKGTSLEVADLVINGLTSLHSRRAYRKAIDDFLGWYTAQGNPGLTKAIVQAYKAHLQERGLSPSTINQRMSAIRRLAQEASDNGLIDQALAAGISNVKGVKTQGVRSGNWLTRNQAQQLIDSPDTSTLKGIRDRAILAIMIGSGLRRSEVAELTFEHIQQREGRWIIVDLVGKGNRVRSVPIPSWAKAAIDEWANALPIQEGRIFRSMRKGNLVSSDSMTPQAIHNTVKEYAVPLGFGLAAHDLRRTFAKLAHKGGAGLEQIQLSLGHASITTTERYLGVRQDLSDAPCDHLGLRINSLE